jgi:hypothetical protein
MNLIVFDVFLTCKTWGKKGDTFSMCLNIVAYLRHARSNLETRSRDYATVDEVVFSPCLVVPLPAPPHISSPHLLLSDSFKHLDDARVGVGHMTVSAVTSRVSTVTQQ